ncbi:MAG: hypothetical protein ACFB11_02555 [Paracoccaceae bacterium]
MFGKNKDSQAFHISPVQSQSGGGGFGMAVVVMAVIVLIAVLSDDSEQRPDPYVVPSTELPVMID